MKSIRYLLLGLAFASSVLCLKGAYQRPHVVSFVKQHDNLMYGVPTTNVSSIVLREGYALGYEERFEQPVWVSYRLTAGEAMTRVASRAGEQFMQDYAIWSGSSWSSDYTRSGYDRGHLAPAADMSWNPSVLHDSFYMSNVTPQKPEFNRGIWKDLEDWVRVQACSEGAVTVVTGPIFFECLDLEGCWIGRCSRVRVPVAFFKVVLDETPPFKAIGFLMENGPGTKRLSDYACSVEKVERFAGMRFFTNLDPNVRSNVVSEANFYLWAR